SEIEGKSIGLLHPARTILLADCRAVRQHGLRAEKRSLDRFSFLADCTNRTAVVYIESTIQPERRLARCCASLQHFVTNRATPTMHRLYVQQSSSELSANLTTEVTSGNAVSEPWCARARVMIRSRALLRGR